MDILKFFKNKEEKVEVEVVNKYMVNNNDLIDEVIRTFSGKGKWVSCEFLIKIMNLGEDYKDIIVKYINTENYNKEWQVNIEGIVELITKTRNDLNIVQTAALKRSIEVFSKDFWIKKQNEIENRINEMDKEQKELERKACEAVTQEDIERTVKIALNRNYGKKRILKRNLETVKEKIKSLEIKELERECEKH